MRNGRASSQRVPAASDRKRPESPAFFFEGAPQARLYRNIAGVPTLDYLSGFPTAVEDFALLKSFLRIKSARMRRCILSLVQATAEEDR
jgi:hypothetical protein